MVDECTLTFKSPDPERIWYERRLPECLGQRAAPESQPMVDFDSQSSYFFLLAGLDLERVAVGQGTGLVYTHDEYVSTHRD